MKSTFLALLFMFLQTSPLLAFAILSGEGSSGGLASNTKLRMSGDFIHSYVEGEDFADRAAEIESMGGDPFFLVNDKKDGTSEEKAAKKSDAAADDGLVMSSPLMLSMAMSPGSGGVMDLLAEKDQQFHATDGKGPAPSTTRSDDQERDDDWEWDGMVNENAHFDQ